MAAGNNRSERLWALRPGAGVDDLRAFVAVARMGTVSRAAEALARTQPSVSARLAALESAWKTRLFQRKPRGMVPTPEGARLLPLAVAALEAVDSLERAAGRPLARPAEVRVGAGDALGRVVLPAALGRLLQEFPGAGVRILEGDSDRLRDALLRGDIDVALITSAGAVRAEPGTSMTPLLSSPVDVLLPATRKPRGKSRISMGTLAGERLVSLHPGSGFRRHLEEQFAGAGIPFRPDVEVGSFSLVRRYVAAGLGVAPVPALAFERIPRERDLIRRRLEGMPPLTYFRVVRTGVPLPTPTARLLEILAEVTV